MSLFIQSLIISFALEGGIIPTHAMTYGLTPITETCGYKLDLDHAYYTDLNCALEIMKYIKIEGGIISYQVDVERSKGFYPFRVDYNLGASLNYKSLTIGYSHGCDHSFTPLVNFSVPGKFDYIMDRFYLRAEIKKQLFN